MPETSKKNGHKVNFNSQFLYLEDNSPVWKMDYLISSSLVWFKEEFSMVKNITCKCIIDIHDQWMDSSVITYTLSK